MLSLALSLLWLGYLLPNMSDPKIEIREIAIAIPPPPPPPPVVQQQVIDAPVSVQVQGSGPSIQLVEITKSIDVAKPEPLKFEMRPTEWQSLEIDWDALGLDQLDGFPTLLTPLRINFPRSLSRKGIDKVLVKLDILIDEQGSITLINIVENPYPELVSEIQKLVRNSRFTAPKKDNQNARARFIWPVEIKS